MASRSANSDFLERHPELLEEDGTSLPMILAINRIFTPLAWYHRFECRGWERMPEGPCVLVANHSANAVGEVMLVVRAWYETFQDRPLRMLAHRFLWHKLVRWMGLAQGMGSILAHPAVAHRALENGCSVLLFPGGEREMARSYGERFKVTLGERTGFVRLARRAGRPILPVVVRGSHASYLMLPGGQRRAQRLGIDRHIDVKSMPMTVGGLAFVASLMLPPLWPLVGVTALQALLPLPARITADVLEPIYPGPEESDAAVAERVRRAMQQAMDKMAVDDPPWTERLRCLMRRP